MTGSIAIDGAKAGDALQVEILDMQHKGWGWTGHIPDFGLLAEDFDYAYIHHWELRGDSCHFGGGDMSCHLSPSPAALASRQPKPDG